MQRRVNGIEKSGGGSLYYSCQRDPGSLFLDHKIRETHWPNVLGYLSAFWSSIQGCSSRWNMQQPAASLLSLWHRAFLPHFVYWLSEVRWHILWQLFTRGTEYTAGSNFSLNFFFLSKSLLFLKQIEHTLLDPDLSAILHSALCTVLML